MTNEVLIKSRIALAQEMVDKLDSTVQFTPSNRGMAKITDMIGLTDHATPTGNVYNVWALNPQAGGDPTPHAAVLASTISEVHGNCDMKAECAYSMIVNAGRVGGGPINTKILVCHIVGHAFCLLCSSGIATAVGAAHGIAYFGEEVVVLDGWQSDYYAPNVWWPYGGLPGPERLYWRQKIQNSQITIVKVSSFALN